MGSWDEGMTQAERAEAIRVEVQRSERDRATLPDVWLDPRTANLLGNYVTN